MAVPGLILSHMQREISGAIASGYAKGLALFLPRSTLPKVHSMRQSVYSGNCRRPGAAEHGLDSTALSDAGTARLAT